MIKCLVYILVGNLIATAILFPLYLHEKSAKERLIHAIISHEENTQRIEKTESVEELDAAWSSIQQERQNK